MIAELEGRLTVLTPPESTSSGSQSKEVNRASGASGGQWWAPNDWSNTPNPNTEDLVVNDETVPIIPSLGSAANIDNPITTDWDFGSLFLVPAYWPKNLPSPCELSPGL